MEANGITMETVHHVRLTVVDVERSVASCTGVVDFELAVEQPPGVILSNGSVLLGLAPSADPERAFFCDHFDENRVGLEHLGFSVESSEVLERAWHRFDGLGVPHGEIMDLQPELGIFVLAYRDPDDIKLELTARYRGG